MFCGAWHNLCCNTPQGRVPSIKFIVKQYKMMADNTVTRILTLKYYRKKEVTYHDSEIEAAISEFRK